MTRALDGLKDAVGDSQLLISIAAGLSTTTIAAHFPHAVRVVRVMPNTPALVLEGVSALARGSHATTQDLGTARQLFEAVGKVVVVYESLMDAVTGLSGSGPAYVFTVIQALADGGVQAGLPRAAAIELAAQTVLGAARMVLETGANPVLLRDQVASPGGTTIRGIAELVVLTQLLASSKQEPPTELLVLVHQTGKAHRQAARLWRLIVSRERATGEPVGDEPWLQSREAFFAQYHAPRCQDDGSDCLVVVDSDSGAFLDVQPQPRAPRHEWKVIKGTRIHDASWNPADAGSALALVTCDEDKP